MTGGGRLWSLMQDERSKIMNSSAFSCCESAVLTAQQAGKVVPADDVGSPGKPVEVESLTCKAVYTKRPHWLAAAASTGVLKLK
jgi:hypothetical protein